LSKGEAVKILASVLSGIRAVREKRRTWTIAESCSYLVTYMIAIFKIVLGSFVINTVHFAENLYDAML